MPALVKIDTGFHKTPIQNYSYSGSKSSHNEFDLQLKLQLQDASSLQDVYDRLHVSTDQISAESAAYALQKICLLREEKIKGDHPESFISAAILNELYDTVSRGIDKISCSTLFMLLDCYYSFICWQESFGVSIEEEIEKRIGDHLFNFEELCSLSNILCRFEDSAECKDLLRKVWIHVQNRWKEINADSIAEIYTAVPKIYFRDVQKLLSSRLLSIYWQLNSSDVRTILSELRTRTKRSLSEMPCLANWLKIELSLILQDDLAYILNTFMDLDFRIAFMLDLGKYIDSKLQADSLSLDLLMVFLRYSAFAHFLDSKLLSKVSAHYVKHYKLYSHTQIQTLVSVFPSLRYIPKNHTDFFFKLEQHLYEEGHHMDCRVLMNIITALMRLGRPPINLYRLVFNYRFFSKVNGLTGEEYDLVAAQIFNFRNALRRVNQQEIVQKGLLLLKQHKAPTVVLYDQTHGPLTAHVRKQLEIIIAKLRMVNGSQNVMGNIKRHYGIIDINLDYGTPSGKKSETDRGIRRVAILLFQSRYHGFFNKPNHLVGEVVGLAYPDILLQKGYWVLKVKLDAIENLEWDKIEAKDVLKTLAENRIGMPANKSMERGSYFEQK